MLIVLFYQNVVIFNEMLWKSLSDRLLMYMMQFVVSLQTFKRALSKRYVLLYTKKVVEPRKVRGNDSWKVIF